MLRLYIILIFTWNKTHNCSLCVSTGYDDEKAHDKWQEETIETYEQAFARIREVTGEDDIDTLVRHFIETEDHNFALFNYVNELNNEVELLQEQIQGTFTIFNVP